jgi:hypothetical protein
MTPDELEALSRKYSNDVWHFLKLASGRWALFNEARDLVGIEDDLTMAEIKYDQRTPVPNPPELALEERRPKLSIDLSKLGL